jgi:hypothetical protein
MEVEYELTPDDLYAFQWRAAFDSPLGRRTARKVYLGWFLALLLFSIVPAIGPDGFVLSRINFTFLLVAFPIVILAQHFLGRWLMRRARTSWAGVHRIEQNPHYIFIYTSPAAAHMIPKRALRDMEEAERFYRLGKTSKEAAP